MERIAEILKPIGEIDACSYVWAQLMFLPSHQQGVEPWSLTINNGPLSVEDFVAADLPRNSPRIEGVVPAMENLDDFGSGGVDDLEFALAQRPLDLSEAEVESVLERWPAEPLDYDGWAEVGMALYHQFEGSDEGYRRWVSWSEKSPKHNSREMRTKYRSFGGRARPKTMASIIKHVGGLRQALELEPACDTFVALEAEARGLADMGSYIALRAALVDYSSGPPGIAGARGSR